MLTVNFKGELGNNLFQLATVLASEWSGISNLLYVLPKTRDCYISNSDRPMEIETMFAYPFTWNDARVNLQPARYTHEDNDTSDGMNWGYHDLYNVGLMSQGIIELDGYFQSPKYFDTIRDDLLNKYFVFRKVIRDRMDAKYGDLSTKIALHVRRGGDREALKHNHGSVSMEYYQRALNAILELTEVDVDGVYVFSDDPDWCEGVFTEDDYTIIRGNLNYEDMYLMTQCSHVIMANSTFSWWGAYLNQNDPIVVYPANEWFGPGLRHLYTGDMFPENWIGV